jgi:hypothetical protein
MGPQLALSDHDLGPELVLQVDRHRRRETVVLVGANVDPGRWKSQADRVESVTGRPVRAGLVMKDTTVIEQSERDEAAQAPVGVALVHHEASRDLASSAKR